MEPEHDLHDLEEAVRHCRAGLKALEVALEKGKLTESIYPTHIYVGVAELAQSVETAMKVALRNQ